MKVRLPSGPRLASRGFSHHLLLPLIAIIAVGSIGAYLTFSSDAGTTAPAAKRGFVDDGEYASRVEGVPSVVRDYLTGGSSNAYSFAILEGGMRHTVLNVGLRELVLVDPSTGDTKYIPGSLESRIDNAVKWNNAYPEKRLTVHVRLHVGERAPDGWKAICGTVSMADPNFGVAAQAPRWWVKSEDGSRYLYRDLYTSSMKEVSLAINAINAKAQTRSIIGSINVPGAAPNYPEPAIIYTASEGTKASLLAGGFTPEEHRAFMLWLPRTAAVFTKIKVELALNPVQNLGTDGKPISTDANLYQKMGNNLISAVGSRSVLANYSARSEYVNDTKSEYGKMYAWMAAKAKGKPRVWTGVQMARPSRVAEVRKTASDYEQWGNVAKWAATKGFHFAETTGMGGSADGTKQPAMSNIWPKSYNDDADDTKVMRAITADFADNLSPLRS